MPEPGLQRRNNRLISPKGLDDTRHSQREFPPKAKTTATHTATTYIIKS